MPIQWFEKRSPDCGETRGMWQSTQLVLQAFGRSLWQDSQVLL